MDTQYHQFAPGDAENTSITIQKGIRNKVVYVLYAVLLILLFILLLITGVKFSQLSKDVNEIKIHLTHPSSAHFEAETDYNEQRNLLEKITPVREKCRDGWVSYEDSCYFLSSTKQVWSAAETQCQNLQGHLIVINNAEELDYISKISELRYSYWIGLVERHNDGHWSWVDGSDYNTTEKFWDQGQPDDWDYRENGEDCGQLHPSVKRRRRLWNDADCSIPFPYICESKS